MNIITHRIYTLELDVWEPQKKLCDSEMDLVVKAIKETLSHCSNVRIGLTSEERT